MPRALPRILDSSSTDTSSRLFDLLLDDPAALQRDETVEAIETVLRSDRRGLDTERWHHISAILQPSIPRLAAIGKLADAMASSFGAERLVIIWRLRGHLARYAASPDAKDWADVDESQFRTVDAESARVLGLALDALEPIVGTAAWTSHAASDTARALAQPSDARQSLCGLLSLATALLSRHSRLTMDDRPDAGDLMHDALERAKIGRAHLAARVWLAASVAIRRPFAFDVEVTASAHAAQAIVKEFLDTVGVPTALRAILERTAPERTELGPELTALVLEHLRAVPITARFAQDLRPLIAPLARFFAFLPPSCAAQLRDRFDIIGELGDFNLAKLVEEALVAHGAPPSTTTFARVDLAELIALVQPVEGADDLAKAPTLVKTYQGDEFRAARMRPIAPTSNPRAPSIHVRA